MRNILQALLVLIIPFTGQCSTETSSEHRDGLDFSSDDYRQGVHGWRILGAEYSEDHPADFLTFEWDYFMVHDDGGKFTGSIGYLIANPRESDFAGFETLVPKGGNVAIVGMFEEGAFVSEYYNFPPGSYTASESERSFEARDDDTDFWAEMVPISASDDQNEQLHLRGANKSAQWDLKISQDWPALSSSDELFVPGRDDGLGTLESLEIEEEWNVDMLWPRTRVTGSITNIESGEKYNIHGHGYRENAWGRWAFNQGGWDFAVVSDENSNVMCAWQTYHYKSDKLDYLDLAFVEDGEIVLEHFNATANQFGWEHPQWKFDPVARQCVPLSTKIKARNQRYEVEATATIGDHQVPLLSDLTPATDMFVIMGQFPTLKGKITNLETNREIEFEGQGGGEFSAARRAQELAPPSDKECEDFGSQFASEMP